MTPFEQGYEAFLKGTGNPYQKEKTPYYHKQWERGWLKAKADKKS